MKIHLLKKLSIADIQEMTKVSRREAYYTLKEMKKRYNLHQLTQWHLFDHLGVPYIEYEMINRELKRSKLS